jgi:hypothetical protein
MRNEKSVSAQDEERTGLQLGLFMPNCSKWGQRSITSATVVGELTLSAVGVGVLMAFLSYYEDTVRFGKEIAPLLKQMGTLASPHEPPVSIH